MFLGKLGFDIPIENIPIIWLSKVRHVNDDYDSFP